jgi:hypothetical protein
MNVILVTEEQYKEEEKLLERFSTASPISGNQKLYTFLPVRNSVLLADTFSASSEYAQYNMTSDLKDTTGFVTCAYDSS